MRMSDRAPYHAFPDRPRLHLPDDARVAVWFIVNVEEWAIERPMPRNVLTPPMGTPLMPDLPNWAWHEYGMRVGFWRVLEALPRIGSLWATGSFSGQCINSMISARPSTRPLPRSRVSPAKAQSVGKAPA